MTNRLQTVMRLGLTTATVFLVLGCSTAPRTNGVGLVAGDANTGQQASEAAQQATTAAQRAADSEQQATAAAQQAADSEQQAIAAAQQAAQSEKQASAAAARLRTADENGKHELHTPQFDRPFDELVWKIDRAGAAADKRELKRLLYDLSAQLTLPRPAPEEACWQILETMIAIELGRYRDARAGLGNLKLTCPVWEVLNNLAVLEARSGATGRSATLLQEAIQAADAEEKAIPRANRRALLEPASEPGDTRLPPALVLIGVPEECLQRVEADCPPFASQPAPARAPVQPVAAPPPIVEAAIEEAPIEDETTRDARQTAEVERAIREWLAAWRALEADRYLAAYAAPDRLPANRLANIGNKESIKVEIDGLEIVEAGEGRYVAEFVQRYCGHFKNGGEFGDVVRKELELVQGMDAWVIDVEPEDPPKLEGSGCD